MVVQFIVFRTLSTLICRGTDISKYFLFFKSIRLFRRGLVYRKQLGSHNCYLVSIQLLKIHQVFPVPLTLSQPQAIIIGFANSTDPDETAHHEPSHLDLRCLTFSLSTLHINFLPNDSLLEKKSSENWPQGLNIFNEIQCSFTLKKWC